MVAAIVDLDEPIADPAGAPVGEALATALLDDRELLVAGPDARFLRSAPFESASDEMIAEALDGRILRPRRDRLRRMLERGIAEGAVRRDLDAEAFADLLISTLMRAMVLGGDGAGPDEIVHHAGIAASGAPPAAP